MRWAQLLAWAIGIEDAQDHRLDAPQRADGVDVVLGGQLADGIRRTGVGDGVFVDALVGLLAIHRARRREDDSAHARIAHGLNERDRAADVGGVVIARIQHTLTDADAGSQMKHTIDAL